MVPHDMSYGCVHEDFEVGMINIVSTDRRTSSDKING